MTTPTTKVTLEKSGEVRDADGNKIGTVDSSSKEEKRLRQLSQYVGQCSRGGSSITWQTNEDLRMLASPQGDLGEYDVQTPATESTLYVGKLDCIADFVCPVIPVTKSLGTYMGEDVVKDAAKAIMPQAAGLGSPAVINPNLLTLPIDCTDDLSLSVELPIDTWQNSDIDLDKLSIRRLVNAFKLDREIRIATLLMTATNWVATNRTAVVTKWNGTTPNPLTDIFVALAKSYTQADYIVFSEAVSQFYFNNINVYQYLTAGELAKGTSPMPKPLIGKLRQVIAGTPSYVWGGATCNAALVVAGDDPEAVSTARTFRYIGDAPDKLAAAEANGYMLRSFVHQRNGARGVKSLIVTVNDQDQILQSQLGGIITGVVA